MVFPLFKFSSLFTNINTILQFPGYVKEYPHCFPVKFLHSFYIYLNFNRFSPNRPAGLFFCVGISSPKQGQKREPIHLSAVCSLLCKIMIHKLFSSYLSLSQYHAAYTYYQILPILWRHKHCFWLLLNLSRWR